MDNYKKQFVDFLISEKALQFGNFVTKSGRNTPYFFNTGLFNTGQSFRRLCRYYAQHIHDLLDKDKIEMPTVIFGPAYKGIPLAVGISMSLEENFNINLAWSFNRKEEKGHGDKGLFVGYDFNVEDKVLIVDDVITSGISINESIKCIKEWKNSTIIGAVVAVNRQEINAKGKNAVIEMKKDGYIFDAIIDISNLVEILSSECMIEEEQIQKIKEYQKKYCQQENF